MKFVVVAGLVASAIMAQSSPVPAFPDEYYGYIPINDGFGSQFFYGLRTVLPAASRPHQPLVMFLQGGPGASSFLGDFMEMGPVLFNTDCTQRENPNSWARHATMLYLDNPIGTGFSFTNAVGGFSTTDEGIADNLVTFLQSFYQKHPEFLGCGLYVFAESYGGKMTSFFGAALLDAVKAGKFPPTFSFKGVGLGDGWVGPIECMRSYGDVLHAIGLVTVKAREEINQQAAEAAAAVAAGQGVTATNIWSAQQNTIGAATGNVNWYNLLYFYDYSAESCVDMFLGSEFPKSPNVTRWVNITSTYNSQGSEVFSQMSNAFMNTGVSKVVQMLNDPSITVAVYNGEVDLIVDPACTRNWISNISKEVWPGKDNFQNAPISFHLDTGKSGPAAAQVIATTQSGGNLQFWNIMRAGHMVPQDAPYAAELMFATIINSTIPLGPNISPVDVAARFASVKNRMPPLRRKLYLP